MARAFILDEAGTGRVGEVGDPAIRERLPEGDVTVRVAASSLNYKDGMILRGLGGLVRTYPHIPGIDLAGEVVESDHAGYRPGDRVICTGWGVGERAWGGYATHARLKGDWMVPLPEGLTAWRAMALGTAGLTAMLAVMRLEGDGLDPGADRPVLVTGAAGGVGSIAVLILSRLGYSVAAVTGRESAHAYLRQLGAARIVDRGDLDDPASKPLDSETWAGCVDAVGGTMLARVLGQLAHGRAVAAVGLAGGHALETTVMPFLLRGVGLLGVDSVQCAYASRVTAWDRLARIVPAATLDGLAATVGLAGVQAHADAILDGRVRGRVVVDPAA